MKQKAYSKWGNKFKNFTFQILSYVIISPESLLLSYKQSIFYYIQIRWIKLMNPKYSFLQREIVQSDFFHITVLRLALRARV